MSNSKPGIVYMGTPDFAVAALQKLVETGSNILAVITAPDRPAGRGKKIRVPAIKEYALSEGLNILQPEKLKSQEFIAQLEDLAPTLQVVVAFRMLPEVVWRLPSVGTFNLHASLLPDYRGAAPINHAIINGETRTGVTSFLIDEKIDTGNILLQEEISIGDEENAGELHDRLMELGADVVLRTVNQLLNGTLNAKAQEAFINPGMELKNAPKIQKADCMINWDKPGKEIHNFVRGLSPYPAAFTFLRKEPDQKEPDQKLLCKIYTSRFETAIHSLKTGNILSDGKKKIKVAVRDGYLHILSLQQEGKRKMNTGEFLSGTRLTTGRYRFS